MARQVGFLKLEGTFGDVAFVKTKKGYEARQKGGNKKGRIQTDAAFVRVRENNRDFGTSVRASKRLRDAFPALVAAMADNHSFSRLVSAFYKEVRSDQIHVRGARKVSAGQLDLIRGYEFNVNASFSKVFTQPFVVTANPAIGVAEIRIAAFVPRFGIKAPQEATHYKLDMGVACVDFDNGGFESVIDSTGYRSVNRVDTGPIRLSCSLVDTPVSSMVVVFGIQFCVMENGIFYPLNNGGFNAMSVAKVV